jgi:hypothetical protein
MFKRPAGTPSPSVLNPAMNRRATFNGPYRDLTAFKEKLPATEAKAYFS